MKKFLLILSLLPLSFCFTLAYNCSTLTSRLANFTAKYEDYNYRLKVLNARWERASNEYEAALWMEEYYRLEAEWHSIDAEQEVLNEEHEWCQDQSDTYNNYLRIWWAAKKELLEWNKYDAKLMDKAIFNYEKAYDVAVTSKILDSDKLMLLKEYIYTMKYIRATQEATEKAEKQWNDLTEQYNKALDYGKKWAYDEAIEILKKILKKEWTVDWGSNYNLARQALATYKDWKKKLDDAEKLAEQAKQNTVTTTTISTKRNNGFSDEYNDAYEFAYANKITTMPTIEEANMYNPIIRAEIAKMLANWVKSLWYTPDMSAKCDFTDIWWVKWDLYTAIIESCQLGIMWQWITKFRPFDNITRWEVATAVSRILWWHQYDWGNPFYAYHINALFYNWVLPNVDNTEILELRWSVMLILMNASHKVLGKSVSSNFSVDDVIDYNDKILDLTAECINNEDEISDLIDRGGSSKQVEKTANNIINICKNSIEQLTKLWGWEWDTSLKDWALKYVALNVVYYQQFLELVPYLDIDNLSITQEKQYNSILEKMDETNEKLAVMSKDLENLQKKFANKFWYQLEW